MRIMKIHISAARPHFFFFHDVAAIQYSLKIAILPTVFHSFSHTNLTLSCKRWGATLKNRRKQTWDVATFRLGWEGTTATAMGGGGGGHAGGGGGHIFYKSWGGRWMGGLVGTKGKEGKLDDCLGRSVQLFLCFLSIVSHSDLPLSTPVWVECVVVTWKTDDPLSRLHRHKIKGVSNV